MKKTFFVTIIILCGILLSTSIQSCYYDNEEVLYGTASTASCDSTAGKFATNVSTIMAAQCATSGCHNTATASAGANLSSYATIKSYITNNKDFFIGSIKHTSGFSAMPKGSNKLGICDISKIESWINAGMLNN